MSEEGLRIAFVHIPRTAGTAFGRLLEQHCPDSRALDFYAGATGSANPVIDEFRRKSFVEKQSYRLLKGHFVFGFDPDLENFRYLVFLRDPVERLISYYFYVLADSKNYLHRLLVQRRMRLEEFLLSDVSIELDNYQVRSTSGIGGGVARGAVGSEHLQMAKRNLLERFAAFGLTERYDDSVAEISRVFGWDATGAVKTNMPPKRPVNPLSDQCRREVAARNHYDLKLYEFAENLFGERSGKTAGQGAR